ncbi:MAG: hypothetical protein ACD_20C00152G0003 [uncultured bacterium]|nr:MAG: hypothetical protein ACD_20C00152G0003 [uncultured bacterium]
MKKLLLHIILIGLLGIILTGIAKADDTTHIKLLGDSPNTFEVIEATGSVKSGSINPENGNWVSAITPKFQTTSNLVNYKVHVSAATQTFPAMTGDNGAGKVIIALAKTGVSSGAVSNAIGSNPSADNNINVIAYHVTISSENGLFGTFNGTDIVATIPTTDPNIITLTFNNAVSGTYSITTDTAGTYTATITCLASDL